MGWTYDKRRTTAPPASQTMTDKPTAQQAATIPNSVYLSMLGLDKKGSGIDLRAAMEAKMAALRRQIPTAEAEADRLSKGVTGTTPEQVRSEMGERMGADFSGVRFHEDAASASRAEEMGANAWTQGNDVYFGAGGFNPSVAAHELVHTVQQGAVESGINTISAPMGGVQMNPKTGEHRKSKSSATSKDETDEERIKREHIKAILAERPILESDYRRHVDHSQDDKSQDEEKSEDKKKRQPRASFYISNLDDRYFKGKMGGNAMSQVYFYKHGVYKPDEHHAEPNDPTLKEGGIKQEDDEGNSLDLRLADRNIAAKVLDNMLDTNVIVNSVKKQFIGKSQNTGKKIEAGYKETKDFAAEGTDGIMMDYAPGVEIDRINWKGFTPQFTTTNPEYADKTSRAKNSSAWKVPVNPNPNGNKEL